MAKFSVHKAAQERVEFTAHMCCQQKQDFFKLDHNKYNGNVTTYHKTIPCILWLPYTEMLNHYSNREHPMDSYGDSLQPNNK